MPTDEPARKTGQKSVQGRFVKGHDPRRGVGKKGRSGRKPERFTAFLAKMRQDPAVLGELEDALKDRTCPGYRSALKVLTDYDTDRPAEKREISGKLEVRVAFTREDRRRTAS